MNHRFYVQWRTCPYANTKVFNEGVSILNACARVYLHVFIRKYAESIEIFS